MVAGCALCLSLTRSASRTRLAVRGGAVSSLRDLNSAIPFMLISAAEEAMTAAFAAILVATAPLFGALIAAVWAREPLTVRRVGGPGAASRASRSSSAGSLPVPRCRRRGRSPRRSARRRSSAWRRTTPDQDPGHPAAVTAAGSQLCRRASAPASRRRFRRRSPCRPRSSGRARCALALLSSAFAFLLYFRLIANVGAVKTMTVNFLSPLFGVPAGYCCSVSRSPRTWSRARR